MYIKTLAFLYCLFISNIVFGQQTRDKSKPDKFFDIGISMNYCNLSNPRQSVVLYKGLGYAAELGFRFESNKKREGISFNHSSSNLRSENELNTTEFSRYFLHYYLERKVGTLPGNIPGFIGGDMAVFLSLYENPSLGNTMLFYDFAQDLRVSASLRKEFTVKKRNLFVDYRIKLPLVAIISRPPKAYFVTEADTADIALGSGLLTDHIFDNGKLALAGKYSTFQSEITLWVPFKKNKNRIAISYIWDLYTYKDYYSTKEVTGTHTLKLSLLMDL